MNTLPAAEHCFVVPALNGPITGGTLYNAELLAALRADARASLCVLEPSAPALGDALGAARSVWVDSLYLEQLPELKRRTAARLGLILHYLPSFVDLGRTSTRVELSQVERRALSCADAFLVTSAFMRDALEALLAPNKKSILMLEPGTHATRSAALPDTRSGLNLLLVGNVVPGKGIEPFLRALEPLLEAADRVRVWIIGSLSADSVYAEACRRLVSSSPRLAERVVFLGALSPPETLAWLARSHVFVSASRMESFGMALYEARVAGLPILARSGGNAAEHVDAGAGGQLAASDGELARACVALLRQPALYAERAACARARAPQARSWPAAAQQFLAQLAEWEK